MGFFFLFAPFSLFIRFFCLRDKKKCFQDLWITSQQFALYLILPVPVSILLFALLDAYLLMDAFLYSRLNLRMRPSFFIYLKDTASLFHSAVAAGLWKFLGFLSMKILYNALILSFFTFTFHLSDLFFAFLFLTGSVTTLFKKGDGNNALFSLEILLFRPLFRKKPVSQKTSGMPLFFTPQCEYFEELSPHFPLLRSTSGFFGEKQFDIRLDRGEKPHLVFLFLESFGARYTGCLGCPLDVTPQFDSLSKKGLLFSHFYSNGCQTPRSVIAALFGVLPFFGFSFGGIPFFDEHPRKLFQPVDCPLKGIPHLLKPYGYSSAYLQNGNLCFDDEHVFLKDKGFETLAGKEELLKQFPASSKTSWGIHDEHLIRYGADFLKKADEKGKPTFLTMFTITNHHPWRLPPGYSLKPFSDIKDRHLQSYLKTTHYTDWCLGLFTDLLKKQGLLEKTILFVFGDHGCPMGEHGNRTIQKNIYEENIHVPLLIYAGGRIETARVIDTACSQVDLLPTVMDILQVKGIHHGMGSSLVRKKEERPTFFNNPNEGLYGGCQKKGYKYIWTDHLQKDELYYLPEDPKETKNIAADHPDLTSKLRAMTQDCLIFCKQLFEEKRFTFQEEQAYCPKKEISDRQLIQDFDKKTIHLKLDGCHSLRDQGLESIAHRCRSLRSLNFKDCLITDRGLKAVIRKAPSLENVSLANCYLLTDSGIQTLLAMCHQLKHLNLNGLTDISDSAFQVLNKKKISLESLDLFHASLTDRGIERLAKSCPQLRCLRLKCSALSDAGLKSLAAHCPQLSTLKLKQCQNIGDEGMETLKTLPLRILTLSSSEKISDKGIQALSELSLSHLGLSGIPQLTEQGLLCLEKLPLLKLFLGNCPSITGRALSHLKKFPLQSLTLERCHNIGDEGLGHLKELSHLVNLFLFHCNGLSQEAVKRLTLELPLTNVLPRF